MTKLYLLNDFHAGGAACLDERDMCLEASMPFLSPERAKSAAQSHADTSFYASTPGGDPPKLEWTFTSSGPAKAESFPYGYTGKVWEARDAFSGTEHRITEVIAG